MAEGIGVRSGRYIGEDGQVYNLVDLLGAGAAPVDGLVKNPDEYSPKSGRVIGEDGKAYNVVDLIAAKQAEINNSIGAAVEPVASQLAEKTCHGIASGLSVTAQEEQDMTVQVESGVAYAPDGTRHELEDTTIEVEDADTVSPRNDIVYVDADGAAAYLAGQPLTAAIPGAREITITENAVAGDVVTFMDVVLTGATETPGENGFLIGSTIAETATNLAGFIDGHLTIQSPFAVTTSENKILIAEKVAGGGNTPSEVTVTGTMAITQQLLTESTAAIVSVEPPVLPEGGTILAQINVSAGATVVAPGDIIDLRRSVLDMPYADSDGNDSTVTRRLQEHDAALDTQAEAISANASQLADVVSDVQRIDNALAPLSLNINSWKSVQQAVKAGLAPKVFPIGSQLRCTHTIHGEIIWDVVAHDHHKKPNDVNAHTMTLLMNRCIYGRPVDAQEAIYYCADGLLAGTYHFSLLAGYDTAYGGGKTYQFTIVNAVPAGGVIRFPWNYNVDAATVKIATYATRDATSAIESNVSVAEGTGGTNLGTADGNTPNMNHSHRLRYGSNNYGESAMRQYLNSNAAANAWWQPSNIFDRPPSYANVAGFVNGLPADFVDVLGAVDIDVIRNTIYEVDGVKGGSYTLRDKFFLPSMTELGLGNNNSIAEGGVLAYYANATQADRIKYDIASSTTARYWWLRSPHPSYANNVRYVRPDGALRDDYASSGYGAAPACVIM